ncbi:hypothetical protein BDV32DRAFT_144862 [Aspergillus pseudonomiae]|nr:hypothetical protein BDV32DRAFT_144862 [Aspergillus pseudonomiae]
MLLSQHSSSINVHGSTSDAPESVHPRVARVNSVASGPSYTPDVRPKNLSGMAKSNTGGTGIAESSLDGDSHGRKVQSLSWRGGIRSGARLASISITRFRCKSRKTRDGLRMETLFEHILFAPQTRLGLIESAKDYLVGVGYVGPVNRETSRELWGQSWLRAPDSREDHTLAARLDWQGWHGYQGLMGDVRQLQFQFGPEIYEDL